MILVLTTDTEFDGKRYIAEPRVIADAKGKPIAPCQNCDEIVGKVYFAGRCVRRGKKTIALIQAVLKKSLENVHF